MITREYFHLSLSCNLSVKDKRQNLYTHSPNAAACIDQAQCAGGGQGTSPAWG